MLAHAVDRQAGCGMTDPRDLRREEIVAAALPCFRVGWPPTLPSIDAFDGLRLPVHPSPAQGVRRSYLLTVTEGAWDDWYASVALVDERGLTVAHAARDDQSLDVLLSHMLADIEEALIRDFVARRARPSWLEEQRRALICRATWVRNLRRRLQRRGREKVATRSVPT